MADKVNWVSWYPHAWAWTFFAPYVVAYIGLLILFKYVRSFSTALALVLSLFLLYIFLVIWSWTRWRVRDREGSINYLHHPIPWIISTISYFPVFLFALGDLALLKAYVYGGVLWGLFHVIFIQTKEFQRYYTLVKAPFTKSPFRRKELSIRIVYMFIVVPISILLLAMLNMPKVSASLVDLLLSPVSLFYVIISVVYHIYVKILGGGNPT